VGHIAGHITLKEFSWTKYLSKIIPFLLEKKLFSHLLLMKRNLLDIEMLLGQTFCPLKIHKSYFYGLFFLYLFSLRKNPNLIIFKPFVDKIKTFISF
jgi:hypothetical protein